jgi:ABC-2 type transport system ATP-binding protein
MENFALKMSRVCKIYRGKIKALDDFTLSVKSGSVTALLGPNGAGKSTAMKILAGLITDFQGSAEVLGQKSSQINIKPQIGYMPQQNALYSELTVRENWDFFAAIGGMRSREKRKAIIEELFPILELSDKADTCVRELSGGMKQRVSLGAAMIHKPKLLLLDEPTVGLDPELRSRFWSFFLDLARDGATILLTTHVFDEVKYCSDIAFVRMGKIIGCSDTKTLMQEHGTQDIEKIYLDFVGKIREENK